MLYPESNTELQLPQGRTLTLKRGNIATENVHVIVNAANCQLQHGGGVAGALDRASGGQLQIYSNQYIAQKRRGQPLRVGRACMTRGGGALKCLYVVHAVGPQADPTLTDANASRLISAAITRSLQQAELIHPSSIAFPALSCGIYRINGDLAARAILNAILDYVYPPEAAVLRDIRIVILDQATHDQFAQVMTEYWGRTHEEPHPRILGMYKKLVCT